MTATGIDANAWLVTAFVLVAVLTAVRVSRRGPAGASYDRDMSIGDFEPDDAYDTAPADPEQVARKLVELEGGAWANLSYEQRDARIAVIALLLGWLRRQGSA